MTWGHCDQDKPGRARTWLYWHDPMLGGKGAGINGTCDVIMKTLEKLHAAGQLAPHCIGVPSPASMAPGYHRAIALDGREGLACSMAE